MKMKKALIGTMMAGALVIGAGASTGTYSDFFSEASSAGNKIELGTLKLAEVGPLGALISGEQFNNLKPGSKEYGQAISIANVGSLPGKISVELKNFSIKDKDGNVIDSSKYGLYQDIQIGLEINGEDSPTVPVGALESLVGVVNTELDKVTLTNKTKPVSIKPFIYIEREKEANQNHLQAISVAGDISWRLSQEN
ncbi:hypothetical protein [Rossellomorea marisflavi]|uniref:hypothetical protein n=1 Tax=Rossellomorea marisflavi TaxID=189381 RepID=UPI001EE2FE39|nr:hypothetical protein [Rossellomorea marisflavi]UKS64965.1 hypothetical protein K6T23_19885 [Rossellomorea marisflavi]